MQQGSGVAAAMHSCLPGAPSLATEHLPRAPTAGLRSDTPASRPRPHASAGSGEGESERRKERKGDVKRRVENGRGKETMRRAKKEENNSVRREKKSKRR